MHDTAMMYGKLFFDVYLQGLQNLVIADVGAQDVNGSLRSVAPGQHEYVGLDFVDARGVDLVIEDPYCLPLDSSSVDVVVSSSCLEHSEFFWLTFNEMLRVLKPGGLLYLNVPSNGVYHSFPVDCWRFYPDSGLALEKWGKVSGYNPAMLESFIGVKTRIWHDFVSVFVKDKEYASNHKMRIHEHAEGLVNVRSFGSDLIFNRKEEFDKQQRSSNNFSLEELETLLKQIKIKNPPLARQLQKLL